MKTVRTVYKIGNGPSSSHTVGPYRAAQLVKRRFPEADAFEVVLYGSLALTGEGHSTDKAIATVLPGVKIVHDIERDDLLHPNTMLFRMFASSGELLGELEVLSIGGGSIRIVGEEPHNDRDVYPHNNFTEIIEYCEAEGISLSDYVYRFEGEEIREHFREVWKTMKDSVDRGLAAEGKLPGCLELDRKAKMLATMRCYNESSGVMKERTIASYAYAVAEENAMEQVVVTAPTCGSCGVIPAVFLYQEREKGFPEEEIIDALAVAGVVGNVIRTNASISGAECGCQAEIGSACSMAAAGLAALKGMNLKQIEYAAEVAMEHHLGLTCDPIAGLVQIPCIERNAVAAMRAINATSLAIFLYETRRVSFDDVVETMYRTGQDLNAAYRETSDGGLAKIVPENMR